MKKLKIILVSFLFRFFFNLLFFTCRFKQTKQSKINFISALNSNNPLIVCSWHSRLLYVARFFKKINSDPNFQPAWAVSSTHQDSEIMAKTLSSWKWKLIRGSSTRGWRNVILKMKRLLKNNKTVIAITNDGPKGPPRIAKRGSIKLGVEANAKIIALSCCSSSCWRLSSWDKTQIPKPFSTIYVDFSKPLLIKKDSPEEEQVTNFLNNQLCSLEKVVLGSSRSKSK